MGRKARAMGHNRRDPDKRLRTKPNANALRYDHGNKTATKNIPVGSTTKHKKPVTQTHSGNNKKTHFSFVRWYECSRSTRITQNTVCNVECCRVVIFWFRDEKKK